MVPILQHYPPISCFEICATHNRVLEPFSGLNPVKDIQNLI